MWSLRVVSFSPLVTRVSAIAACYEYYAVSRVKSVFKAGILIITRILENRSGTKYCSIMFNILLFIKTEFVRQIFRYVQVLCGRRFSRLLFFRSFSHYCYYYYRITFDATALTIFAARNVRVYLVHIFTAAAAITKPLKLNYTRRRRTHGVSISYYIIRAHYEKDIGARMCTTSVVGCNVVNKTVPRLAINCRRKCVPIYLYIIGISNKSRWPRRIDYNTTPARLRRPIIIILCSSSSCVCVQYYNICRRTRARCPTYY